jgi:hypothetical protein
VEVRMHSFGYTTGNAFRQVQWVLITVIIGKASSIHCLQFLYAIILRRANVSVLIVEVGDQVPGGLLCNYVRQWTDEGNGRWMERWKQNPS